MTTDMIEELVLRKRQAEAQAEQVAQIVTALCLLAQDDKGVVRIPRATLNQVASTEVRVEVLKSGSLKLVVRKKTEGEKGT